MKQSSDTNSRAQSPTKGAELLDTSILSSIRHMSAGDDNFLKELIELFLKRVPMLLNELKDSSAKGDAKRFTSAAHSLKGSSGNMGAQSMMEACAWLEEKGHGGNVMGHESKIAEVERLFHKVAAILRRDWT